MAAADEFEKYPTMAWSYMNTLAHLVVGYNADVDVDADVDGDVRQWI
jgi:hypothetical protein